MTREELVIFFPDAAKGRRQLGSAGFSETTEEETTPGSGSCNVEAALSNRRPGDFFFTGGVKRRHLFCRLFNQMVPGVATKGLGNIPFSAPVALPPSHVKPMFYDARNPAISFGVYGYEPAGMCQLVFIAVLVIKGEPIL